MQWDSIFLARRFFWAVKPAEQNVFWRRDRKKCNSMMNREEETPEIHTERKSRREIEQESKRGGDRQRVMERGGER